MNIDEVRALEKEQYWPVFSREAVCFVRGEGNRIFDIEGKVYLDFITGVGVALLGHSNLEITRVINEQAMKLLSCSNLFYSLPQLELASSLSRRLPGGKWFFANSGAEANEGAIKLARKYGKDKGRYEIITALNSFHGRTLSTLAATGQPAKRASFEPLPRGFIHVPLNDLQALESAFTDSTIAVMVEPIQGESGVYPCEIEYLKQVEQFCRDKGILLILDEIQTGLGRTGKFFAYEHFEVKPDILTLGKGLANGVPIGAVWARNSVALLLEHGDHGSTYGGNAFACKVGLEVLRIIDTQRLVQRAKEVGDLFLSRLNKLKEEVGQIKEVRGRGLMVAIELSRPIAEDISSNLLHKGFVVGKIGNKIIRFLPPLTVSEADIDLMINALEAAFREASQ